MSDEATNVQSVSIVRYEPASGRIVGVVTCPPALVDQMALPNEAVAPCPPGVMDTTHYVLAGTVIERPGGSARLQVDIGGALSLVDLLVPCDIHINGSLYPCADGTAELVFDQPGTYVVRVVAWPYLDQVFEVIHENLPQ